MKQQARHGAAGAAAVVQGVAAALDVSAFVMQGAGAGAGEGAPAGAPPIVPNRVDQGDTVWRHRLPFGT